MKTKIRYINSQWASDNQQGGWFTPREAARQDGKIVGRIDVKALCKELARVISELEEDGYEVMQIIDVTSGKFDFRSNVPVAIDPPYAGGYGYSFTEGLIVVAKKAVS
ncbi:hypothetical protein [Dinoroseobacter sp. S76]|uniref:hypothetical protein n=1 Tax=Dinoroseobacter sp. S76 TaxID=3415124 RepID=UPI003C7DDA3C